MLMKNTATRYGVITIFIHWLMAVLIVGLLVLGLYMTLLPINHTKLILYGWHKEYGLLALGIALLRFTWRLINLNPRLSLSLLEKIAARTVHWAFYIFMFAMPISGWLITSAAGLPTSFFGIFILPDFISASEESRVLFEKIHQWLGYGLIITIVLHSCAALKHHFINKDDILKRML